MKTITFERACRLINESAAVIIDGTVSYMDIDEDQLSISWEDEGREFQIIFLPEDNAEVQIVNSELVLVNSDGESETITLLGKKEINP